MSEQEFDSSTPRWFVRRLNGMRAAERRRFEIANWQYRRLAYLTGQWKKGTKEDDIWRFDHEIQTTVKELEKVREIIETNWNPVGDA